jgi:hypothetical protein
LECLFADGWDPSSLEAMIAAIDDEELKGAGVYASSKAATE